MKMLSPNLTLPAALALLLAASSTEARHLHNPTRAGSELSNASDVRGGKRTRRHNREAATRRRLSKGSKAAGIQSNEEMDVEYIELYKDEEVSKAALSMPFGELGLGIEIPMSMSMPEETVEYMSMDLTEPTKLPGLSLVPDEDTTTTPQTEADDIEESTTSATPAAADAPGATSDEAEEESSEPTTVDAVAGIQAPNSSDMKSTSFFVVSVLGALIVM